ncbi:endoribonuclease Dicer protein [Trifolium repens]|nr:endoribonuclease Dicer protein [Trifolium repens]
MEEVVMDINGYGDQQIVPNALPFARRSGKTLTAIMLLRSYACRLCKSSPYIAVFFVSKVILVSQQAETMRNHTDLKVGMYWGDMGVGLWDADVWKVEMEKHELRVFEFLSGD